MVATFLRGKTYFFSKFSASLTLAESQDRNAVQSAIDALDADEIEIDTETEADLPSRKPAAAAKPARAPVRRAPAPKRAAAKPRAVAKRSAAPKRAVAKRAAAPKRAVAAKRPQLQKYALRKGLKKTAPKQARDAKGRFAKKAVQPRDAKGRFAKKPVVAKKGAQLQKYALRKGLKKTAPKQAKQARDAKGRFAKKAVQHRDAKGRFAKKPIVAKKGAQLQKFALRKGLKFVLASLVNI